MKRNKPPKKLIPLTYPEAEKLKKKLYKKQKGSCPILKIKIPYNKAVLDHKHKKKAQKPGPKGRGLVRGVISNQANVIEGIIWKKWKRQGISKIMSYEEFLENLLEYIKNPPVRQIYIYPSERKFKTFGRREYNRICKYYFTMFPRAKKLPEKPRFKNGKAKLTKHWHDLLNKANKLHKK